MDAYRKLTLARGASLGSKWQKKFYLPKSLRQKGGKKVFGGQKAGSGKGNGKLTKYDLEMD